MSEKQPMSPAEFDANLREFEGVFPDLISRTSGLRTLRRNAGVGGHPQSKHLIGMAQDFALAGPSPTLVTSLCREADLYGFWYKPIGPSEKWFLGVHLQGLPPGDVPEWWLAKYWDGKLPWETE